MCSPGMPVVSNCYYYSYSCVLHIRKGIFLLCYILAVSFMLCMIMLVALSEVRREGMGQWCIAAY